MENNFHPLLVDKDIFINYYKDKGLTDIINGLSWVTESFGILDQLKHDPVSAQLKKRLINNVLPELKKEPVGEKALHRLIEIENYIKMNNSLDSLERKIDQILRELSKGYRILLQGFVTR